MQDADQLVNDPSGDLDALLGLELELDQEQLDQEQRGGEQDEEDVEDEDAAMADLHAAGPTQEQRPAKRAARQLTHAQFERKVRQILSKADDDLASLNEHAPPGAHVTHVQVAWAHVIEDRKQVDKKLVMHSEHAEALFNKNEPTIFSAVGAEMTQNLLTLHMGRDRWLKAAQPAEAPPPPQKPTRSGSTDRDRNDTVKWLREICLYDWYPEGDGALLDSLLKAIFFSLCTWSSSHSPE